MADLTGAVWRKSIRSNAGGNCVEGRRQPPRRRRAPRQQRLQRPSPHLRTPNVDAIPDEHQAAAPGLKETGRSQLHQHRPSLTDRSTVPAYPPDRPARTVTASARSLSWSGPCREHLPGTFSPRSR